MRVSLLRIRALRRLQEVELVPGPGLNLLVGDNGAGKTSVLEALHLMAYGRSFRGRVRDGLVRTGADALEIYVEWNLAGGERGRRAGLRHSGSSWEGRLDGRAVTQLGDLCAALAVVTLLLFVFAVKSALFPLWFWLPDTYHTCSISIAALFSGLLTKVGIYAMIRLAPMVMAAPSPAVVSAPTSP